MVMKQPVPFGMKFATQARARNKAVPVVSSLSIIGSDGLSGSERAARPG